MPLNLQRRAFLVSTAALATWPKGLFADAPARMATAWENPDGTATDAVMARRLHIDLAGRIPTKAEAQAYVKKHIVPSFLFFSSSFPSEYP